jgi:hypothetical protein
LFYRQRHVLLATTEQRPEPTRQAERSPEMWALPERRGRNTSQRQAESVARPPKVLHPLRRQTAKSRASLWVEQRL